MRLTTSQPLAGLPSQSPKPPTHAPTPHTRPRSRRRRCWAAQTEPAGAAVVHGSVLVLVAPRSRRPTFAVAVAEARVAARTAGAGAAVAQARAARCRVGRRAGVAAGAAVVSRRWCVTSQPLEGRGRSRRSLGCRRRRGSPGARRRPVGDGGAGLAAGARSWRAVGRFTSQPLAGIAVAVGEARRCTAAAQRPRQLAIAREARRGCRSRRSGRCWRELHVSQPLAATPSQSPNRGTPHVAHRRTRPPFARSRRSQARTVVRTS